MLLSILNTELADNVKASSMQSDGSYYRKTGGPVRTDSQAYFMEHSYHVPDPEETAENATEQGGFFSKVKHFLGFE